MALTEVDPRHPLPKPTLQQGTFMDQKEPEKGEGGENSLLVIWSNERVPCRSLEVDEGVKKSYPSYKPIIPTIY